MAPGLPDRVDCAQLADDTVVLERVYPINEMSRLRDLVADPRGQVRATFAFGKSDAGRAGATGSGEAELGLICRRCRQDFKFAADGSSEIEFSSGPSAPQADGQREVYETEGGMVSLRELAEEELLLALPIVAMHAPQDCGRATAYAEADEIQDTRGDRTRPFMGLQDLLKKT